MTVQTLPLEELTELDRPITYGVVKPGIEDPEKGILFIRGGDVIEGKIDESNLRTITQEVSAPYARTILRGGELVISLVGNPGAVAVVPEHLAGANLARQVGLVAIKSEFYAPYIKYYLMSPAGKAELFQRTQGAVQQVINLSDLKKIQIRIPPRSEQERIADILSAYDDLIENNRRRIALLEESARLLYREWFVYLRFPGHEHVKVVDGVPEGWERRPLGDLLTLQRGFDLPTAERIEGKYPIYASTGINGYHNKAMVTGPGVITGRSGSLGTVLYSQTDFWPLNTALWVKEFKCVSPEFALFLLGGLNLEQYNGGVAVPTLNRNDVHRIEVLLPPKALIDEFTDLVLLQLQQIDNLTQYNHRLREARDFLLPRLMNGEVQV